MVDVDTFLTTLYVMIDDFCQSQQITQAAHPGPQGALSCSEVAALALFGQWAQFPSERAFYRYAEQHLRTAFPTLPHRSQFNRLQRTYAETITAFGLFVVDLIDAQRCHYERIDSSGIAVRDAKRRGEGWLAGQADIGWSNRLGWYEGFHLLVSIAQEGMITGYGFGPASTHDQLLMETFLAARAQPIKELSSVGKKAQGSYIADKGFAGEKPHQRWQELYGAQVITPPHQSSKQTWPKEWRQWLAHLRQGIEGVFDKLLNTFRLARERPHALTGFQARLAAKISLHNFCIWLNGQLQRPPLAFADLLDW
jgi:DDE family transposase